MKTNTPDLEAFLAAPYDAVAELAPQTIIMAFGGIRRSAILAGIDPQSPRYMSWQREGMLRCFDLLFRHGVRHIIAPQSIGEHLAAAKDFRDRFFAALDWAFAGPEALADYAQYGWRVRLLGTEQLPELAPAAERLRTATATTTEPTLWFSVCADDEAPLQAIFDALHRTGARTRDALVQAVYGEAIPPASMLIGFGQPTFSYDLIPPLLFQRLECYWIQRPGYTLTQDMARSVFYDYAYTRRTGSGTERGERYANLPAQRAAWETEWVLGVGVSYGGSWYPAPFAGSSAQ